MSDILKTGERKVAPKANCKCCFGRGIVGKNVITKNPVVCYCVAKQLPKKTRVVPR